MAYSYITFLAARNALSERLYDLGKVFWGDAELKLYLTESLRTWNALTAFWVNDYVLTLTNASTPWQFTSTIPSPRQYTLHDTDLYAIILYHLIEQQLVEVFLPGASLIWGGTTQFDLADLVESYERRQNEILTVAAGNVQQLSAISLPVNTRTITLTDNILDIRRARYVPAVRPPAPQTLWRGDSQSFQYFTPRYRQTPQNPRNYVLSGRPPLTLDVDFAPPANGVLDMLGTLACTAPAFNGASMPFAGVPLAIPDDWAWVLKWGMLMDLLNIVGEPQDTTRAQYAATRYAEGLQLLQMCPWLLSAEIANVPYAIEAVMERDMFDPGWETNATTRQGIITAGIDLFSVAARPTGATVLSVTLELVQAAPVPVNDGDFVQIPRDVLDAITDYAVHLAVFKEGGKEFTDTIPLFDNFRIAAGLYNQRIANLGLYDDIGKKQGKREEAVDPRYASNA